MLLDNFINIRVIGIFVPGFVRIYHQNRSFLATIQAAGIVNPAPALPGDFQFFKFVFGIVPHRLRIKIGTTNRAVIPLIGAKEYVVLVVAHENSDE